MPFEVPESWRWTTIEDLLINRDSERIPLSLAVRNKQHKKEYNYYGAAGVIDKVEGYLFSERLLLIGEDGANLLSRAKDNAFFADGKYWVNNHAHVLDCSEKEVLTYVALVINSMALDPYVTGSAQPKLSQDNLNKILIPLPPLAEQRRIIYAINNYSVYLSNIENDKESIEHIIDLLKQLILNLAITGKLVSQELNDEPAIELLKRIYPSFVPADNRHYENKPFLIPDSWLWVMGKDLFLPMKNCKPSGDYFKYIDIDSIDNQDCVIKCPKVLPVTAAPSRATRYTQVGDILFSMVRPYLKNIAIVTEGNCIASTGFYVCSPNEALFSKYCYYLMISPYVINGLTQFMKGDNSPSINNARISEWLYPLPPLNEQKRIVQKIDEIFNYLDSIVAEL